MHNELKSMRRSVMHTPHYLQSPHGALCPEVWWWMTMRELQPMHAHMQECDILRALHGNERFGWCDRVLSG